jgi:tetratricopeptide (TPR) repeat protein
VLTWLGDTSPRLLRDDWFEPQIRNFDRSSRLIESGDYAAAAALIDSYSHELSRWKLHMPLRMTKTLATVRKLGILAKQPGPDAMFNLGLAEIEVDKMSDDYLPWRKNAIRTFEHLELAYPASDYAPRASYLRAAIYRDMQEYDKAIAVVDDFLKRYPTSSLADDMLAERGVHELLVTGNWQRAKVTFDGVVRRFPKSNAADNALNWMAWYRLRDCDYAGAYETYQRLAVAYPANRLGIRAMAQMLRIQYAVNSRRIHMGIAGLRLSRDGEPQIERVESGSAAEHVGFTEGATVTAVDGVPVYTAEAFYALLQHMIPNRVINVALASTSKVLQPPVQPVAYYAETYDSLHAAPFNHVRCGL